MTHDRIDNHESYSTKGTPDGPSSIELELTKVLNSVLKMTKAEERLRKFKIFMLMMPITLVVCFYFYQKFGVDPFHGEPYVSLVEVNGEISSTNPAASSRAVIAGLQKAFMDSNSKGVFISIDSPGGSPAESEKIHDEILTLKEDYPDKKVIAFGNGSMTSGAYWIATAADEIHAMPMTMVGSIGVKMESYDFSEIAEKYQISKRVITAGEHKVRLDPFLPAQDADVEKFQSVLAHLHTMFKDTVLASRKEKIDSDKYDVVFSGDFWLGEEALELGLIDTVSTPNRLLKSEFGTVHMKDYSIAPNILDTLNKQRVLGGMDSMTNIRIY